MNKNGTKEALIQAGLELIRSTGYSATGINQILNTANARSFYNYFTSKDDFVIEVIKLYVADEQARLERVQASSTLSPLEKLRRYFEDKIAFHGERGQFTGCLLGNLSLEVAGHNLAIRDLLRRSFDDWQKSIAMTIRESIDKGELPRTAKANTLAAVIVDSWEGAQVRAKTEQSNKALNLFYDCTFNVLLKAQSQVHKMNL
jgi:TetR/AcrR family transcriptional regulator, transcriptional repressor for nem operon